MIWFILTTIVTYIIYYIFIIRKYDEKGNKIVKEKKNKGKSKREKEVDQARYPTEVELFIYKYRVDLKKINFRGFLKLLGFVCSLDIAIIVTILSMLKTDNTWILLGVGVLLVVPVILISYSLLGRYFTKKGLTKKCTTSKK
ncbi:MAG: hypothetical protein IJO43_03310 [Bacilli bacterium]|nr:hypothetical protein [Bacilli bacterium]